MFISFVNMYISGNVCVYVGSRLCFCLCLSSVPHAGGRLDKGV